MRNKIRFDKFKISKTAKDDLECRLLCMPLDFVTDFGEYPDFLILQRYRPFSLKYIVQMPRQAKPIVKDRVRCIFSNKTCANVPRSYSVLSYSIPPGYLGLKKRVNYSFILVD